MLEKNGAITDETPAEITPVKGTPTQRNFGSPRGGCCGGGCHTKAGTDTSKLGSTDHAASRVAAAVTDATKK